LRELRANGSISPFDQYLAKFGRLTINSSHSVAASQTEAWRAEIDALRHVLANVTGHVLLEFDIARIEAWARKFFDNWRAQLKWQRLKPYEDFADMIERHWDGIAQDPRSSTSRLRASRRGIPSIEGAHVYVAQASCYLPV
jgi:hypothetical protein